MHVKITLSMNKQEAKKRVEKLREAINKYRYSYHVLDKSLISDEALDARFDNTGFSYPKSRWKTIAVF